MRYFLPHNSSRGVEKAKGWAHITETSSILLRSAFVLQSFQPLRLVAWLCYHSINDHQARKIIGYTCCHYRHEEHLVHSRDTGRDKFIHAMLYPGRSLREKVQWYRLYCRIASRDIGSLPKLMRTALSALRCASRVRQTTAGRGQVVVLHETFLVHRRRLLIQLSMAFAPKHNFQSLSKQTTESMRAGSLHGFWKMNAVGCYGVNAWFRGPSSMN